MESLASTAAPSTLVLDAQSLQQILVNKSRAERDQNEVEQAQMLGQIDRSARNRMNDEIVAILSDAMSIMKKTGEEVRNSGR